MKKHKQFFFLLFFFVCYSHLSMPIFTVSVYHLFSFWFFSNHFGYLDLHSFLFTLSVALSHADMLLTSSRFYRRNHEMMKQKKKFKCWRVSTEHQLYAKQSEHTRKRKNIRKSVEKCAQSELRSDEFSVIVSCCTFIFRFHFFIIIFWFCRLLRFLFCCCLCFPQLRLAFGFYSLLLFFFVLFSVCTKKTHTHTQTQLWNRWVFICSFNVFSDYYRRRSMRIICLYCRIKWINKSKMIDTKRTEKSDVFAISWTTQWKPIKPAFQLPFA